ncbi:hypothetical protein G1H11_02970 [Phytoactinopolyspora alkaliphila]|uniref:Methyltransferase domain-containing protein n=1 Tax=Phytoactinopolyspora alkaliphila TaxID=1783498 RepID=A0A6N9YGY9_9ACTN|nr:methyltransferase domain-containing protein [Phytoactinopolyspora alkaliphila]NED94266.1 hypothetical protein [Phytoactinopolyspora alkaliphila]
MPDPVLEVLSCPVCRSAMRMADRTLRCAAGHSYDVARQGYVNLHTGRRPTGTADTAPMVAARAEFLGAGHFDPIATAVSGAVADAVGPLDVVADIGAGTGFYLGRLLDRCPEAYGVATDVSPYALRRAARAHPRSAAVGADAWHGLPFTDGGLAALLDVFAPRNADEFSRVLRAGGVLVVVTPMAGHLAELIERFGMLSVDERKDERVEASLAGWFTPEERQEVTFTMCLDAADVARLIRMGPSAHHLDEAKLERELAHVTGHLDVTASVLVSRYRHSAQVG